MIAQVLGMFTQETYHKQCWARNVANALRPKFVPGEKMKQDCVSSQAANVEFLSTLSEFIPKGNVTTMEEIKKDFKRIAFDYGLKEEEMK